MSYLRLLALFIFNFLQKNISYPLIKIKFCFKKIGQENRKGLIGRPKETREINSKKD